MLRSIIIVIASLTFVANVFAHENWPEFRGPNGDGISDATGLPATFSDTENVRWKTAIHDKGWSSPVVWGDQIWLTTATEDGKQLFAICVDLNSGQITRDIKLFDIEKPQDAIAFNSYASPTPAIEAGRVYVHFGSPGTAAIDTATGQVLWNCAKICRATIFAGRDRRRSLSIICWSLRSTVSITTTWSRSINAGAKRFGGTTAASTMAPGTKEMVTTTKPSAPPK